MLKKGLGRGLSNLIPSDDSGTPLQIEKHPEYQEIEIEKIQPNPDQPRKRFNEQELQQLSRTLISVGLIEPIVVRTTDKQSYQIISGERRWRACRLAGFKKIPAIVKNVSDVQALEIGIIENIQREELNSIEEAKAYELWIQKTGLKPGDIADRVGKDRSTITNLLRLLKLPEEVQSLIEEGHLSAGQARPLIGLGDKKILLQMSAKIAREGWSARKVEDEVTKLTQTSQTLIKDRKDPNIKAMEDKIRNKLSTKVKLSHKKNGGGSITIFYQNLEEMDRIMAMLSGK